jgi:capsular polysaccharide biosynthesis protein
MYARDSWGFPSGDCSCRPDRRPGAAALERAAGNLTTLMRTITPGRLPLSRAQLEPLLRLALIPLVAMIIGAVCGLVYSFTQSTLYESRSQVVVSPASGFVDPAHSDSFAAITTTVQELALTQSVLNDAVGQLGRGRTAHWLRGRLRLTISGDTPLLTIAGVSGNQGEATTISVAETDALVKAVNAASATEVTPTAPASGLSLKVFAKGDPAGRVQPETGRNFLLGASAGLIIGCFGLAQLLSRESRRRSA